MAFLIDTIDTSGLFAQSANSATIATKDSNGNDITATYQPVGDYYSASNPSGFITGVDLTPYQTKDDMSAYQPSGDYQAAGNYYSASNPSGFLVPDDVTGKMDVTGMTAYQPAGDYQPSGDYYSASNPSGFITDVPAGTLNESAFEFDNGLISAYNGSAFKAGDELPESVSAATDYVTATSGDINNTINNVSANSGTWGGSALPISAGPGIKVNLVDNTLVFSNDETVLYSANAASNTIVLSEKATNFERLRLELQSYQSTMVVNYTEVKPNDNYLTFFAQTLIPDATYPLQILGVQFSSTNGITYNMKRGVRAFYKTTSDWGGNDTTDMTSNIKDAGFITKVVGINRIGG